MKKLIIQESILMIIIVDRNEKMANLIDEEIESKHQISNL